MNMKMKSWILKNRSLLSFILTVLMHCIVTVWGEREGQERTLLHEFSYDELFSDVLVFEPS